MIFQDAAGQEGLRSRRLPDYGATAGKALKNPEFKQAGINGSDIARGSLEDLENQQKYLLYLLRYFERLTQWEI